MNFLKNLFYVCRILSKLKVIRSQDGYREIIVISYNVFSVRIIGKEVWLKVDGLLHLDSMFLSIAEHYYDGVIFNPEARKALSNYRRIVNIKDEQEREQAYREVCNQTTTSYRTSLETVSEAEGAYTERAYRDVIRVL